MAKIISFIHQKGGVGKTTLAYNSATVLAGLGQSCALLDIDPQGSLRETADFFPENLRLLSITKDYDELKKVEESYLFVDTPPYLQAQIPQLLLVSDYVVIPTKPGYYDALAISKTVQAVKEAQNHNKALKALIVLNMVKPGTSQTREVMEVLQRYEMPIAQTMVGDRVAYQRAAISGGVNQTGDEKAHEEILNLLNEIL
jgi:chromosome partitioning protein